MLKKAILCFCILVAVTGLSGKVSAQEKVVLDQVVAVVGNSAILYSEVNDLAGKLVQERREQGWTSDRDPLSEALEHLLLQKLLYNQALIDSVEINSEGIAEAVEEQLRDMVEEHGSVNRLEAHMHCPIFDIRRDMINRYEERYYASSMRSEVMEKVTITPGEVERFYKRLPSDSIPIIPEQYVYAHIVKFPSSTTEAKQRVRERLLEMRERIINGTRFDRLARMYSMDQATAIKGGEMDYMTRDFLVAPYADAMVKLRPGQVSEVVETEFGFHLIELIDKKGDLYKTRHILLRPQFTDDELAQDTRMLDSLARAIRNDSITFEQAAFEYSDDPHSKNNGGIVSNHNVLEMYNAFDAKLTSTKFLKEELTEIARDDIYFLSTLKPGEISNSFSTFDLMGNQLTKIVKLLEIIPSHPANLKEDYLRLEEMALQDKQQKEFLKWLDKKIGSMFIRIDPEFRYDDFENPNWLK